MTSTSKQPELQPQPETVEQAEQAVTALQPALETAEPPRQQMTVQAETATQLFALHQREAKALSVSSLVPDAYKNNVANCVVAVQVAYQTRINPMVVMQNLHVIKGKPSWSSTFIIAAINACGRFSPLRFEVTGTAKDKTLACHAWAYDLRYNDRIDGPTVTWEMAEKEGWAGKGGSKWQTMPELMIRYRAAAFFGRLHAPEMLMGMHSPEEVEDYAPADNSAASLAADFNAE